jgi:phosphoribosylanthranilate isomerase
MTPGGPVRVKVCGLTSVGHLRAAEALGASYVGLIVETPRSPRSLTRAQARLLARAARAPAVLVTTAVHPQAVAELVETVRPAVVQLHGGAGPERLRSVRELVGGVEVWHVVSVDVGADAGEAGKFVAEAQTAIAAGADKLVVDAARGGQSGGTGTPVNWEVVAAVVEAVRETPVLLAGGLHLGNVAEAIGRARPAGVDVSSGVETAPGVKSPRLIRDFMRSVAASRPE